MKKFCKDQIKCVEDTAETWTCTAHLDSGQAFRCPYTPNDIRTIEDMEVAIKPNSMYPCIDYRAFEEKKPSHFRDADDCCMTCHFETDYEFFINDDNETARQTTTCAHHKHNFTFSDNPRFRICDDYIRKSK